MKVAWSPDELVHHVRSYLDDPAQDRDGRARVVREQCEFIDGRAAERVAGFVAEEWHATQSPRRGAARS